MKTIIVAMLFVELASAQTRTALNQVKAPPAAAALIVVVLPNGHLVVAQLEGLEIDTSGPGMPVLRLKPFGNPFALEKSAKMRATAGMAAWSLPDLPITGTLKLYRNGLRLTDGEDYTTGTTGDPRIITFLDPPAAGDLLLAEYRTLAP